MTRAFLCAVALLYVPGCAHFCGDAGRREGAWGIVFHCQSGAIRAAPMQAQVKTQPVMSGAEPRGA